MTKLSTLTSTECHAATAAGLLDIAHYLHETASPADWAQLRDPFGFLLNAISAELARTNGGIETLCHERHAGTETVQ